MLAAITAPFSILVFRFAIGFRQVWQVGSFLAHTRTYARVLFKTSKRLIARHRCNKHLTEESVREKTKENEKTHGRKSGESPSGLAASPAPPALPFFRFHPDSANLMLGLIKARERVASADLQANHMPSA